MLRTPSPSSLYGLVDMGSNGIRFSITDLSPETARSLPTVYQDREGISLFDAQYSTGVKGPIPQETIDDVLAALKRFKIACADFHVPPTNVRILATEATRTAENSVEYRRQINQETGWEVDMLPKEAEGRIGAMGVASSFATVEGLVMDLGGGSTQITWMIAKDGHVQTSPKGSISFPYGAAAMTRKLAELAVSPPSDPARHKAHPLAKSQREILHDDMKAQFQQAYEDLDLPDSLRHKADHGGLTLYLSGGGFRGWGYLLMSQHRVSPYPVPIINGFCVTKRDFHQTDAMTALAAEGSVFRISQRRAGQVPAVAFVVNVLVEALPMIQHIRFCQGGVREGFLFDSLDAKTKALDPLEAATAQYGAASSAELAALMWDSLPGANNLDRSLPATFTPSFIRAVADMMYLHLPLPKESRSMAALYAPVTGVLASAHGVSHADRALLALTLSARWDSELAPPHGEFKARLSATITHQEVFWANYLGALARLVGNVYPAGLINAKHPRVKFSARWADGLGKKGLNQGVILKLRCGREDAMTSPAALRTLINDMEKVGKKKNRVGGEHGYGVPIEVEIERDLV